MALPASDVGCALATPNEADEETGEDAATASSYAQHNQCFQSGSVCVFMMPGSFGSVDVLL